MTGELVLRADDLSIEVVATGARIVDSVSLSLYAGDSLGLVGESGCGKSTLVRALVGLLPPELAVAGGTVSFGEGGAAVRTEREFAPLRGRVAAMVFQDPSSALNPLLTVGAQLCDGPRRHQGLSRRAARALATELLERVGVPDPALRLKAYPHQLSGGLRQRVMIAIALSSAPRILLCDEPTTALDVTIQDQILSVLDSIRRDGVALVFVSHDLAVVDTICDRVAVMYAGRVVERGTAGQVFRSPAHPYTTGLLAAMPDVHGERRALRGIPGAPPDPHRRPIGCCFRDRCPVAVASCATVPDDHDVGPGHVAACHLLAAAAAAVGGSAAGVGGRRV